MNPNTAMNDKSTGKSLTKGQGKPTDDRNIIQTNAAVEQTKNKQIIKPDGLKSTNSGEKAPHFSSTVELQKHPDREDAVKRDEQKPTEHSSSVIDENVVCQNKFLVEQSTSNKTDKTQTANKEEQKPNLKSEQVKMTPNTKSDNKIQDMTMTKQTNTSDKNDKIANLAVDKDNRIETLNITDPVQTQNSELQTESVQNTRGNHKEEKSQTTFNKPQTDTQSPGNKENKRNEQNVQPDREKNAKIDEK